MRLEGIHHVTAITADAPGNVDFYARLLGLRLVKKTVNQDDPTVYHLFYADERGSPGSDITFFEYPGARPGRAGAGMVHRVVWRVASPEALDFWEERLRAAEVPTSRSRLGLDPRRARGVARTRARGRGLTDAGHRPLLLQVDLFPRAERGSLRDRDDRARLHDRRAGRAPRGAPLAAPELRAPPRAGRAGAHPAPESAGELGPALGRFRLATNVSTGQFRRIRGQSPQILKSAPQAAP